MKILFAINRDIIQKNLMHMIQMEGIKLDFDPERDSVFSKDLIVEKIKYNLNSQEPKYDIAIINEKLDGEYDLIEIVRFLRKNNIRPIILMGQKRNDDPLIHALIKRKVYDFLYGKLRLEDIFKCIVTPTRYEDIEHLVDIKAEEYKVQGKSISDSPLEGAFEDGQDIIDADTFQPNSESTGPAIKPPELNPDAKPTERKFPGIGILSGKGANKKNDGNKSNIDSRINYVAQVPNDYKKNIVIYSNQQVGKSFVACNLATSFAAHGKKTVLVDLDFKNKSQYYYFDMSKFESRVKNPNDMNIIAKVFEHNSDNVDELMNGLFSPMRNLYVVTSHPDLEVQAYDLDSLYKTYMMLRNIFDVVVYDLPGVCGEDYLKFLMTQAEDILILTNQNCSILDRTEKDLKDVLSGYFVNNKMSLLINQYINHKELSKGNIRDHLSVIETRTKDIEIKFKNVFIVPNNYPAVVDGVAKGKPACVTDDELKQVFEDIANKYYPDVDSRRSG